METKKCKTCKKLIDEDKFANKDTCTVCFNKPKPKQYYDIHVDCMLPGKIIYRVLAENAEQAASMIKNMTPTSVKYNLIGRKELKLTVYDAGCLMIRFCKRLFGG